MTGGPSADEQSERAERLPEAQEVYTPASAHELAEVWSQLEESSAYEPIAVGAKEHITRARVTSPWAAVETTGCDAVVCTDVESGVVRVEPGLQWGEFRMQLRDAGLGVEMLGLQPVSATIGGLLGRRRHFEPQFERGDIRQACIGLTTTRQYTYGEAPRKASGPDLRYMAVGGESRTSLILEASLTVTPPPETRLIEVEAPDAEVAMKTWRELWEMDVRLGWAWWRRSEAKLWASAYGPEAYLKAVEKRLEESGLPVGMEGGDAVSNRRSALERQHPDRRILSRDQSVWAVTCPWSTASEILVGRPGEDVVVARWGPHRVTAWVFGVEATQVESMRQSALGARRVSDGRFMVGGAWHQARGSR